MPRPLRIEYPGALHHVTARGNARADIYLGDDDRLRFLDILALAIERYGWLCHGYCLMDNHYHLLIETPNANLSRGMRHVNGVYTQAFNRHNGRVGHLFQGRYKAILVEGEAYLLELARYVVLNPVRAGMVKAAGDWPWSSYHATAGDGAVPEWLSVAWLHGQFGAPLGGADEGERQAAYRRFVAEGTGKSMGDRTSPLADGLAKAVTAGSVLGSEEFLAALAKHIIDTGAGGGIGGGHGGGNEVVKLQRYLSHPSLATLRGLAFPDTASSPARRTFLRSTGEQAWMVRAQREHGYTLAEIAAHAGCHYSTVSKIITAWEAENSKRKT